MEMVSEATSSETAGIQMSQSARIEVIGVGGGGSNAVNRMIISDLEGVAYRVLNTDAQALIQSHAKHRLQLGQTLTRGLGAGGNPTIGQKAAEESRTDLHDSLQGSDLVFIAMLRFLVRVRRADAFLPLRESVLPSRRVQPPEGPIGR